MKPIRIICGEEIMAHFPDGRVKFLTFWQFIQLAWYVVKSNTPIVIEGGNE